MTPEEEEGWVEALDRVHAALTDAHSRSDPQRTLYLLAHSVALLVRLEADRMRVSADAPELDQLDLFPDLKV